MKNKTELVRGWLRKAKSNVDALDAAHGAGVYDAACFHAQQAVEIYLKAYLIHAERDFPFTHNLSKLVDVCVEVDASFNYLVEMVEPLTPYAIELRYDHEFWPDAQAVEEAKRSVAIVKEFVLERLPAETKE